MKTQLLGVILSCALGFSAAVVFGGDELADDADAVPRTTVFEEDLSVPSLRPETPADAVGGMLARLPYEPIDLSGSLIVRRQRGVVLKEAPFTLKLRWGETPQRAIYEVGGETFTVVLPATNNVALLEYVAETDVTWLDLSLAFLWWQDLSFAGEEEFRGSLCDIILAKPPTPSAECAAVKLFIDRKLRFLRKAEQIDARGEVIRRMWVASIAKINDKWMIKNMEVERPHTGRRTKLHVESLKEE